MALNASHAVPGGIYRPTRNADGTWYELHPTPVAEMIKRYERKKNPWCKEIALLAQMKGNPDWPLFYRYVRGTDPFTGKRFEYRTPALLCPDHRLRRVKSRPGFTR